MPTIQDFVDALTVEGVCPRRAVLVSGKLAERAAHPDAQEVDVLSRLCELARAAQGLPSLPRHTIGLLECALGTNDAGAWAAAANDLDTEDFDIGAAIGVLGQEPSHPGAFVACLAQARDAQHAVNVLRVFASIIGVVPAPTRELFGRAIGCQLRALIDTLVRHGAMIKRDVREAVYAEFGKMMAVAGVPGSSLADVLHDAIHRKLYDVLRMFLPTPIGTYIETRTFTLAVDRVRTTPALQRQSVLSIVAKALRENPALADAAPGLSTMLESCVTSSVGDMDVRGCLALSIVAQAVVNDDAAKGLAGMLEHACARIIETTSK